MDVISRVNLRQLKALVAVARSGGFTKAARLLNLSQPALTVQIRLLEDALGLRLLDRNKRSVSLTQAGLELVPSLERLMRELEAVLSSTQALAGRSRGSLAMATLPSIAATVLPQAVAQFHKNFPSVHLRLQDAVAQRVIALVKAGEVDFGIGTLSRAEPELIFTRMMSDDLKVIFPADHPLHKRRGSVTLEQLSKLPLVLTTPDTSVRVLVDEAFDSIGQIPQLECEASYMSTAISMVRVGMGVTILPLSAIKMEGVSGLFARPIAYAGFRRDIGIIRRVGRSLSPAAESFIELLSEHLPGSKSALV
jgi:LysR family carnitine catabolism transcriptional activator